MSISGIGTGPVTPVTNQTVAPVVTKVPQTSPVQLAASESKGSQRPQNAGNAGNTAPSGSQPLNARGRGQIVNLLV
jgi:hypothetical protein